MPAYDIIGDVHGQSEKLIALLTALGYQLRGGAWRHQTRSAIFVGDLIDRGPNQVGTINIVRRMTDVGSAKLVLGNHELNSISWATPDPDAPGEYLRRRSRLGNRVQHQAFLTEVEGTPLHDELIIWFKTLPLWLDLGEIRVVHACWNDAYMSRLKPSLRADNALPDDIIVLASRKNTFEFEAIETICKGIEIRLPHGVTFLDKEGQERHSTRIKWWAPDSTSLSNSMLSENLSKEIPNVPLPDDPRLTHYQGPPVFFGHYWMTGEPKIQANNIACVDYSAGRNGALVAYRWNGEPELKNDNFFFIR